jgi:hypothetical protein
MRRTGPEARRGAPSLADAPPAGSGPLIARIVLALLLIAAIFAAILYGAGALHDGSREPFNVTGTGAPEPVGEASSKVS